MFQSSTISFESKSCNVDAAPEHIWKCEKTVASKYNRHPLYQFFFQPSLYLFKDADYYSDFFGETANSHRSDPFSKEYAFKHFCISYGLVDTTEESQSHKSPSWTEFWNLRYTLYMVQLVRQKWSWTPGFRFENRWKLKFAFSMVRWVEQKGFKATGCSSKHGIGYIFFTFCTVSFTNKHFKLILTNKLYLSVQKFLLLKPYLSVVISLVLHPTNQHMVGSNPSISNAILHFMSKFITKYIFFEHRNQLNPVTFLTHTGGTDSGFYWLAK